MIGYIILLFFVGCGESAIFYIKENNGNNWDPSNLEFFKLQGLKVDGNSDTLKNDLSKVISSQVQKIGSGKYDESVPLSLADYDSSVPDIFDYKETCDSLVGSSSLPVCRLHQKQSENKKHSLPRSCQEVLESGKNKSGIYEIYPRNSRKPFLVLCDMETKGGGWTHIQKRFDGSQDFHLSWREYKFGFGDLNEEFWIGLENIYHMTGFEINELLIELTDRDQKKGYAQYSVFAIGAEKEGYSLKELKGYSGDAGDALTGHIGYKFTTKDVDQDPNAGNCAVIYEGAWWYTTGHSSNLNGKHMSKPLSDAYKFHGLNWNGFRGHDYNLAGSRMLIRPVNKN